MSKTRRKRSTSATWRRPRNMPLAEWEKANETIEAEMIAWARTLVVEDDDGRVRKLTEEEVLEVAKAGQWEGSARAARKKAKKP
ncbi:MAG: hypothetical protein HYU53_05300 [Acidobacteria bacterium]|nr:hypothetical protein [Acidobacteriota bacterium]